MGSDPIDPQRVVIFKDPGSISFELKGSNFRNEMKKRVGNDEAFKTHSSLASSTG